MEPLPIAKMQIDVYNKEESPLHQIVKKLIYKKILDLEPYNFNYVYGSSSDLAKKIYGPYVTPGFQERAVYDFNERDKKQKEIRETMIWGDSKVKILTDYITQESKSNDRIYESNPFGYNSRKAITYIPLRSYKNKVFMEYAFFLNGLKIIPDITLMNDDGKPETIIEILYKGLPKAEKLIKYIESDLNVIFVFADQAIADLSTDMTCRRDCFRFPIREAWLADTSQKEKISRAVNIFLQSKMYKDKEYITSKTIIKNTQWKPYDKWKRNRMNIGLKISTNYPLDREIIKNNRDLSHSMIQMKETSDLIILLRYMQKHTKENLRPAQIPIFEGQHHER